MTGSWLVRSSVVGPERGLHNSLSTIEAIEDHNLRLDAQQRFTKLKGVLVRRPPCCDWPGDDDPGWGKEAADSHMIEPLHQVVAQSTANIPGDAPSAALIDTLSPGFRTLLQQDTPLPASLAVEVSQLRTLLLHAECLVISMPYPTTTAFAFECIRQAIRRPSGFGVPVIHVHQGLARDASAEARMAGFVSYNRLALSTCRGSSLDGPAALPLL